MIKKSCAHDFWFQRKVMIYFFKSKMYKQVGQKVGQIPLSEHVTPSLENIELLTSILVHTRV